MPTWLEQGHCCLLLQQGATLQSNINMHARQRLVRASAQARAQFEAVAADQAPRTGSGAQRTGASSQEQHCTAQYNGWTFI